MRAPLALLVAAFLNLNLAACLPTPVPAPVLPSKPTVAMLLADPRSIHILVYNDQGWPIPATVVATSPGEGFIKVEGWQTIVVSANGSPLWVTAMCRGYAPQTRLAQPGSTQEFRLVPVRAAD